MISRPDDIPSPGSRPTATLPNPRHAKDAPGGGFIHHERCDCPECRIRYRQGRGLASTQFSTVTVTVITMAVGVLALAGLGVWLFG